MRRNTVFLLWERRNKDLISSDLSTEKAIKSETNKRIKPSLSTNEDKGHSEGQI